VYEGWVAIAVKVANNIRINATNHQGNLDNRSLMFGFPKPTGVGFISMDVL
jgi:hypothetical protein